MKIVLLFPPYSNLRTPYLSLPTLSSFIRELGHRVTIRDLNLDLFYDSLSVSAIKRACLDGDEEEKLLEALPRLERSRSILMGRGYGDQHHRRMAKQNLKWAYDRLFKGHETDLERASISEAISWSFGPENDTITRYYNHTVIPWLRREGPHLVGVSIPYPNQMGPSLRLARLIKRQMSGMHVVLGGPQISKFGQDLAKFPEMFQFVDFLVPFEGERPMEVLLDVLENGRPLSQVPNLIYREGEGVISTAPAEPKPMNHLPTPEFQGLYLDRYLLDEMMLPLITSRGCYWGKCSFCTYREIHTRGLEFRDVALVVEDMRRLSDRHGCQSIRIVDDALSPKRCRALSKGILAAGLGVKWRCSARLERGFTPALCRLMGEAGCEKVAFGLESYNQRVLDLMKKGVRVGDVKPILKNFTDAGIKTHLCCMIGFPTETQEEAEETKRFLENNRELYRSYGIQTFNLEAGTELDRRPAEFGITKVFRDEKLRYGFRYGYRFETESGLSREEAEEITREARDI